ncbi:hypothetical protein [Chromobacterium paludis]|uniref:Uncharacterized protein n=1 Tax=Chromobacterium paludis TaxID=2605945 RepID=A0A5C1DH00_9NEIS|nr:hypothetical protein [Chromobacterium paludis]QEL56035.1 hypothetical protein FYK34_10940 [Chromobacterium paludis]
MNARVELDGQGVTWASKVVIAEPDRLLARMRAAGLPLQEGTAGEAEGESDNSKITALVAVGDDRLSAIVATPSGLVYRLEPERIEPDWWSFAARYYYIVTGNLADRQMLAELAGIQASAVKGKTISRKKSAELSGLTLDQLLDQACPESEPRQDALFS